MVREEIIRHDLDNLLSLAFRYALGRRSYVVQEVINLIHCYEHALSPSTIDNMLLFIDKAIESGQAGMQMDVDLWRQLRKHLEDKFL